MAEGYSAPPPPEDLPDDEYEVALDAVPKKRSRLAQGLLESFRLGKEKDDDDEDKAEATPKANKLSKILRWLGVMEKEDVPAGDKPERSSLFFDVETDKPPTTPENATTDSYAAPVETAPAATAHTEAVPDDTTMVTPEAAEPGTVRETSAEAVTVPRTEVEDTTPPEADTETAETAPDEAPGTTETAPKTPEPATPAERTPDQQEIIYKNRRFYPEAVALAAYEHHHFKKLKKHEEAIETEVKHLNKEVEKSSEKIIAKVEQQQPRVERAPQVVYERPQPLVRESLRPEVKTPEKTPKVEKIEKILTHEQQRVSNETKELQKERRVEVNRPVGELDPQRKQEIIERILTAPERVTSADPETRKDIAYELSHEHKDMDRQSQAAWAKLQATAEATAKANAEALAHAEVQIPTAMAGDALKEAAAQKALERNTLYKKAAVSGVITAIVIIAVLLVIVLASRK